MISKLKAAMGRSLGMLLVTNDRRTPIASTTMTSVSEHRFEHKAEAAAEHTVDIHTTSGKLADLRRRTEETLHPVGEAAVEKVHAKGKLTARERIYALLASTPPRSPTSS